MRRLRLLAALVAGVVVLSSCAGDGGEPAEPSSPPAELPVPRTEVAGVAWRERLAVVGGLTPDGGASDLVHLWNPAENTWESAPPLPRPLHHAATVVVAGRLVVVGGYTNLAGESWAAQRGVYSLGEGETAWRDEDPLPSPRAAHAAATASGLLVVVGGEADGQPLATTAIYEPGLAAWRKGPSLARPREHLAAASTAGRIYAIAGRTSTEGNFAVVESLNPVTDSEWRPEPDLERSRGGIAAATVDGTVCVAGGEETTGTIAPVECLTRGAWRVVADLARPRHGLAVMALGGRLHVVGGGEQPGLFVSGAHEAIAVSRK